MCGQDFTWLWVDSFEFFFYFKIVIAIFHSKMNLPYIIMALGCLCGELELAPV